MSFVSIEVQFRTESPVTFTHHGVEGLPTLCRGVDLATSRPLRTVFIPGAQLKSRLRHADAISRLKAHGGKLADAYKLAIGQVIDADEPKSENTRVVLGQIQKQRNDDHNADLFGAWKIASRMAVSHLVPAFNIQPESLDLIRRDLDASPELVGLMDAQMIAEFESRALHQSSASTVRQSLATAEKKLKTLKKQKAGEEQIKELEQLIEELAAKKKDHSEKDSSNQSVHLVSLEAIPTWVDLAGYIRINRYRHGDLQIVKKGFDSISADPYWGAQRTRGFGLVSGSATYKDQVGDVLAVQDFGFNRSRFEVTELGKSYFAEEAA